MKNEFTVILGQRPVTLYSLAFKTDVKLAETATINSGLIRRLTGSRKNFYTLKGRMPFDSFLSFCGFINTLIGQSTTLTIGQQSIELSLSKGECTACEEGMCEFTIELEEAEQ